jgi:signal transduction histidine kinase
MTTAAIYLGPDRRLRARAVREQGRVGSRAKRVNGGRLLAVLALALVAAAVLPLVAARLIHDPAVLTEFRTGISSLSTALFVAAALSYVLRWRLTGEAPVALVGVALLVYGSVLGFFLPLAPYLGGAGASAVGSSALVRTVTSIVVMYLLVRSLSTPIIDSALRPARLYVTATLALVAVFGLLTTATSRLSTGPLPESAATPLSLLLAFGWGAAALLFVRRAADRLQGDVLWLGLSLGCLSLANVVRALPVGHGGAGLLSAGAVSAVAAAVSLYGGARHVTELLGSLDAERLRLRVDLVSQEEELQTQRERREESLHDVRSTLAAIRCAAGTLQRYGGKLASTQRATLTSAVTSELVRLERLIDPANREEPHPFDLGEAIAGVVETERALGSEIVVDLRFVRAAGRPEDTAEILQNLLVNARRYAQGSRIRITSYARHGRVELCVEDFGPGLSAAEREEVFGRGSRGRAGHGVPGSGLGLYVSRRLATEQGGELIVTGRRGGGARFVLRLPSAVQELGDEQRDVTDGLHGDDSQLTVG